jgi:hypothetical protein
LLLWSESNGPHRHLRVTRFSCAVRNFPAGRSDRQHVAALRAGQYHHRRHE